MFVQEIQRIWSHGTNNFWTGFNVSLFGHRFGINDATFRWASMTLPDRTCVPLLFLHFFPSLPFSTFHLFFPLLVPFPDSGNRSFVLSSAPCELTSMAQRGCHIKGPVPSGERHLYHLSCVCALVGRELRWPDYYLTGLARAPLSTALLLTDRSAYPAHLANL